MNKTSDYALLTRFIRQNSASISQRRLYSLNDGMAYSALAEGISLCELSLSIFLG